MVPESFGNFFVASAGVSGALIGLLFVATAIAPERTIQKAAPAKTQETAAGAFIVLSDTLFIALSALIPGDNTLGVMAIVVAATGIVGTLMFAILTWIHRSEGGVGFLWALRRVTMVFLFAWQLSLGRQLLQAPGSSTAALANLAFLSIIFYAIGLERAWDLLGGRGHGVGDAIRAFWEERQRRRNP